MKAITFFAFLNEAYREEVREKRSWQNVFSSAQWDSDSQRDLIESYDEYLDETQFDPDDYSGIRRLGEVL